MSSSETAESSQSSNEGSLRNFFKLNYSVNQYVIANIIVTCSSLCQCFIHKNSIAMNTLCRAVCPFRATVETWRRKIVTSRLE